MKKLIVVSVLASSMLFVGPAQADACTPTTVVGSVCVPDAQLPGVPPVPVPAPVPAPIPEPAPLPAPPPPEIPPSPQPAPEMPGTTPDTPAPATPTPPPDVVQSGPQTQQNPQPPANPEVPTPAPSGGESHNTTPPPAETTPPPKTEPKHVTIGQAIGISILALILGPILAVVALYIVYRIGRSEGEAGVNEFTSELIDWARNKNLDSEA